MIPILLIEVFIYSYLSQSEMEQTKEIIIEEQKQRATVIHYIIEDIFEKVSENLLVVKNSNELKNYLKLQNENTLAETEQLFLRIADNKKDFDQICLIDRNGKEVIQVNQGEGSAYLVADDALQNKENEYDFRRINQLSEGEIYISDMDLSEENGEIQVPYKPVIRIAVSLYSSDNVYQGNLIIRYLGEDLLNLFHEQFKDSEYSFIEPSFVNKDGYYLFHRKEDKTFGFMFDGKKDATLAVENPNLWKEMTLKKNGYYQQGNKVVFFMQVNPSGNRDISNSGGSWYILSQFHLDELPMFQENIMFGMKLRDILMLIGIAILMLIIVIVHYYSQKDKEQLSVINRIAENINDAVIITNHNTNIIYANNAFERITGYKKEEVLGLKTNYFKSNKQSSQFYQEMWKSINHKGYWQGELWDKKKDGMLYPKKLNIYAIKNKSNGSVEKYIGIFTDLTKHKEEQEYVTRLKNYNIETNLPNESLFLRLLDHSIKDNKKNLIVIYFSIENYNSIVLNLKGENSLFINQLIDRIRDMLNGEDFIAQITKNNFVIGLSSIKERDDIDQFLKEFFEKNKKSIYLNHKELYFDIKAGISRYPEDGITSNELMTNAYIALENVVNEKEKKYLYYDSSLKYKIEKEIEINLSLRKAISNNELDVYYQPQVEIEKEKVIGAEALLRWENKQLGQVSPVVFIPLAEKTGQIIEIGYWLIERVFQDYQFMQEKMDSDFRISINISPIQFKDRELLDKFKELAQKYEVNFRNIEIEITESLLMTDIKAVNEALNKFKELGMTVAIDDFGTGFSSLSYLKNLNIDKLKIDRSFIKDYPQEDNGEIAQVITNMANKLKLNVITEGAETKEQIGYLKSIGCHFVQGYYYSRPLTKDDFYTYLNRSFKGCE